MSAQHDDEADSRLILAAEECPPESFVKHHKFSSYDDVIMRKLSAHGPVLVRGGRGSGKGALLLEARQRIRGEENIFLIDVSLRYLPLLQSDGEEYIGHFCAILSDTIQQEIVDRGMSYDFDKAADQLSLQHGLTKSSVSIRFQTTRTTVSDSRFRIGWGPALAAVIARRD